MQKFLLNTITALLITGFSGFLIAADEISKETPGIPPKLENAVIDFKLAPGKNPENKVNIETEYFNVDFDAKGGNILSFRHKDPEYKLKNNVDIVVEDPFYFNVYKTPESFNLLKNSNFRLQKSDSKSVVTLVASLDAQAVTSKGSYPVVIKKVYSFEKSSHYWDFSWQIENKSGIKLSIPELYFIPMNDIGPSSKKSSVGTDEKYLKNFYYVDGDFKSSANHAASGRGFFSCGKEETPGLTETIPGNIEFFGMGSRFMILTIQPLGSSTAITSAINNHQKKEIHAHLAGIEVEPKSTGKFDFLVFTGPKVKKFFEITPDLSQKRPVLKQVHKDLYKAFDFGITAPIRDIIVAILKALYQIIPNYGVAIILLVFGLKLVFYPLNQAQARSMKKMQVIQPLLKQINDKYKNNAQEKQRKTLELYRQHKANPMGGCLPMVIQIPIFIALISAFSGSYELWGSPFIKGWIDDLSEPDTIYRFAESLPLIGGLNVNILPVIMAVSQVLQTQFTMVSVDKNQKLMMQVLPIVMVVMLWNFPSGVVLYWILFNILSVLQQYLTNKFEKTTT
jgi:YidC/Oxa1 family membrane protein insertase